MIIQKLNSAPTDAEYIQAFRDGDNVLIGQFLRENKDRFYKTLRRKFEFKDDGILYEVYQVATERLWERINSDDTFTLLADSKLANYMIGFGIRYAYEYKRSNRNIVRKNEKKEDEDDNCSYEFVDEESAEEYANQAYKTPLPSFQSLCEEARRLAFIDYPYMKFLDGNHTPEECAEEFLRLTDAYNKATTQKDRRRDMSTDLRLVLVDNIVDNMGKPCEPLLKGVWWDKKDMDTLASELGYSNADCAKTQKYKCVKKLEIIINDQMNSFLE